MKQPNAPLLIAVPMKDPSQAKTRLKSDLHCEQRKSLARWLFRRTLASLEELSHSCAGQFDVAVVTASAEIAASSGAAGINVISEPWAQGLNRAADRAASYGTAHGYRALCILPADLAAPSQEDLARLVAHCPSEPGVVLCPSQDLGTNALMLSLPWSGGFAYGPRSFLRHHRLVSQMGITPLVLHLPSLRGDVDHASDLRALVAKEPGVSELWGKV